MNKLYTATATSTGDGRNGHVTSSDGVLEADLSTPKEMGGAGGGTNPEQLFAAGYSACFHSALKAVARGQKIQLTDVSVTAAVDLGTDDGGYGLAVELTVALPGMDPDAGQQLVDAAHQVCPYSRATRGNIDVTVRVA